MLTFPLLLGDVAVCGVCLTAAPASLRRVSSLTCPEMKSNVSCHTSVTKHHTAMTYQSSVGWNCWWLDWLFEEQAWFKEWYQWAFVLRTVYILFIKQQNISNAFWQTNKHQRMRLITFLDHWNSKSTITGNTSNQAACRWTYRNMS